MNNTKMPHKSRKVVLIVTIAIMAISIFVLYPILSSVNTYSDQFKSLDDKRNTALTLIASSSAASAIITLIPDDIGTPIAEQLVDLTTGFMIVLAVILAEKYLLPLLGGFTTGILIPVICILSIVYYYKRDYVLLKNIIIKLIVLSIVFLTLIPVSISVSDTIENTFKASIDNSINEALSSDDTLNIEEPQDRNLWQRITGAVSDAFDYVGKAVEIAKTVLGNYIEAMAVMIVVNCIIPLLVLAVYILLIKYIFSLDFSLQKLANNTLKARREIAKKNLKTLRRIPSTYTDKRES